MIIEKQLIQDYLQQCENKRLSPHTLKAYKTDLKQMYDFFCEKEITKQLISQYIEYLNKTYKPKTVKRKLTSMHAFFEQLIFDDFIEQNPMHKVRYKIQEEKKLPRIITHEQLHDIFSHLEKSHNPFVMRDKAIIETLISTGIRVSELCSIREEDVYLDEQYLRIYGKNAKERVIYLGNDVLKTLSDYKEKFASEIHKCQYFFINNVYHPITDQSVRIIINKYTKNFHITPHMFRHSFATMLLEQDVDITYIQKILGHSSITTTSIYAYASVQRQKEILLNKNPRKLIK